MAANNASTPSSSTADNISTPSSSVAANNASTPTLSTMVGRLFQNSQ